MNSAANGWQARLTLEQAAQLTAVNGSIAAWSTYAATLGNTQSAAVGQANLAFDSYFASLNNAEDARDLGQNSASAAFGTAAFASQKRRPWMTSAPSIEHVSELCRLPRYGSECEPESQRVFGR